MLLAGFLVTQFRDILKKVDSDSEYLETIGPLFFLSCLANAGWILAWHNLLIELSLVVMIVLFLCLLTLYLRLGIGCRKGDTESPSTKFLVNFPFSVYLGWISIALIANVTALLVDLGVPGFGFAAQTATIIVITIGTVLALLMLFRRRDFAYALVILWAFGGIAVKRMEVPAEGGQAVLTVSILAGTLILVGLIAKVVRR